MKFLANEGNSIKGPNFEVGFVVKTLLLEQQDGRMIDYDSKKLNIAERSMKQNNRALKWLQAIE